MKVEAETYLRLAVDNHEADLVSCLTLLYDLQTPSGYPLWLQLKK